MKIVVRFITSLFCICVFTTSVYCQSPQQAYAKLWEEELIFVTENGKLKNENFELFGDGGYTTVLPSEYLEYFRKEKDAVLSFSYKESKIANPLGYGTTLIITLYFGYENYVEYSLDMSTREVVSVLEILNKTQVENPNELIGITISQPDEIFLKLIMTDYELSAGKAWIKPNKDTYYVKANGKLALKSTIIGGIRYKFTSDGVCKGKYTGWTKSSKGRRYWKDGILVTNRYLRTKSGVRYFADENGYVRVCD